MDVKNALIFTIIQTTYLLENSPRTNLKPATSWDVSTNERIKVIKPKTKQKRKLHRLVNYVN